jgi:hypothetical protein
MENEMDDLKKIWKSAKGNVGRANVSADTLIQQAKSKKKKTLASHYGNIGILASVAVILWLCFRFLFPFRETLSRTGVALMIGGLIVRIAIEFFSIVKSNKVRVSDTTARATEDTIAFYEFRRKIHGPVTLTIVILYIIGFYLLSPEFSKYMTMQWVIIMDIGFLVGAGIMSWAIRTGIRQELEDLRQLIEIRRQLD